MLLWLVWTAMVVIALVMSVAVTWLLTVPLVRAHKASWICLVAATHDKPTTTLSGSPGRLPANHEGKCAGGLIQRSNRTVLQRRCRPASSSTPGLRSADQAQGS